MAERKLVVSIIGDERALTNSLKRSEVATQKFGQKMKTHGLGIADSLGLSKGALVAGGVTAGIAVVTGALVGSVRAAKEAQVAQANLRQALQASGISWAKQGKAIDGAIQKTSKLAGFDDEEVSKSFANLVRSTGSVAKATRDIALASNIARARHLSLAAATKVVEKAEIGQLRGLKAVGVELGKNTTSTEAIRLAQKKFAGSAEQFGRTAAGAQARLGVAFENLQEKIGAGLLPVLTKLTLKLVGLIDWAETNFPAFQKAIEPAVKVVRVLFDNLAARIKDMVGVFQGAVKVIKGIAHGDWSLAWTGIKQIAVNAVKLIFDTFVALPLKLVSALGRAAWKGLTRVGVFIKDAIVSGFKRLAAAVAEEAKKIGRAITQGILNGIGNIGKAVGDKIKGALGGAVKGAKGLLGIHSPSRVFELIGLQIGAGLNRGITASLAQVTKNTTASLAKVAGAGHGLTLTAPMFASDRLLSLASASPTAGRATTSRPFSGGRERIDVHMHVDLDRRQIANAVELDVLNAHVKRARRNPKQRRGQHAG